MGAGRMMRHAVASESDAKKNTVFLLYDQLNEQSLLYETIIPFNYAVCLHRTAVTMDYTDN